MRLSRSLFLKKERASSVILCADEQYVKCRPVYNRKFSSFFTLGLLETPAEKKSRAPCRFTWAVDNGCVKGWLSKGNNMALGLFTFAKATWRICNYNLNEGFPCRAYTAEEQQDCWYCMQLVADIATRLPCNISILSLIRDSIIEQTCLFNLTLSPIFETFWNYGQETSISSTNQYCQF